MTRYKVIKKARRVRLFSRITPIEFADLFESQIKLKQAIKLIQTTTVDRVKLRDALATLKNIERELWDRLRREFFAD